MPYWQQKSAGTLARHKNDGALGCAVHSQYTAGIICRPCLRVICIGLGGLLTLPMGVWYLAPQSPVGLRVWA